MICPKCSGSCTRVRRGRLVKIFLPFIPLKRYHCDKCIKKFYSISSSNKTQVA